MVGLGAVPQPSGAARLHEPLRGASARQVEVPIVDAVAETGRDEQRLGRGDVTDELLVGVGVGDEVLRGRQRQPASRRPRRRSPRRRRRRAPTDRRRPSAAPPGGCRRRGRRRRWSGAITSTVAFSASTGGAAAPSRPPRGAPSVTSTPTLRPANDVGPLARMLSAGDGGSEWSGAAAGSRGRRQRRHAEPVGDASRRGPRRRCAGWRPCARGSSARSTLLSSNVKASTMCCCSTGVWLRKNWPAWL